MPGMKTFQEYITEQNMSVQDAEHLLGLHSGYTTDQLKAAYKKLAIRHHPDKGGDLVTMQRLNAAYDKLSNVFAGGKQSPEDRMAAWHRSEAQARVFLVSALGKVKQKLNIHAFTEHFKSIFGEDFTQSEKQSLESSYAAITVEFSNHTRTTVLDLVVSISSSERFNRGLGTPDHGINMYVSSSILHNRRKLKLTQQNYRFEHDYALLSNPEIVFPAKKLGAKKSGKKTKFSRKDVILSFQKELHATFRDNWLSIPVPHIANAEIVLYRSVYMRTAAWAFNGVYEKNRRTHEIDGYVSVFETEASINWLIDQLKHLVQLRTPEEIKARIEHVLADYKAHRARIDPELAHL
jgi:hypothetical protein